MSIVHHVREKSQAKGSARTLLLNLAIYANDCCGVAWPADATLAHEAHVSRQRIHELKNALKRSGELVIVERPGTTNLYYVAWHGTPLGGTYPDTGEHDPRCPLRYVDAPEREVALQTQSPPPKDPGGTGYALTREGSEFSDTPTRMATSPSPEISDPLVSESSDTPPQISLTQKQVKTREKNNAPPAPIAHAHPQTKTSSCPRAVPLSTTVDKPEAASPYWCAACRVAIPTCEHRVIYGTAWKAPPGDLKPAVAIMANRTVH
jgi:hypothetical protein